MSTDEEQGEREQRIGLEEECRGPQRTSLGLVSTQRLSKLKRVSSHGGYDDAMPGAVKDDESLLTIAKRSAARRMLYSRFYRGGVLKGEYEEAVVSIKGRVHEEAEGVEQKKKRKREGGEGEEHQKKKKKKRKKKNKEKELEGERVV